ncbi:type 1 glutamine amidotransferase [Synechococcus sp. PCC 6312]|uniref:type 1 glutamine amidotransferase n=1 Tax=Synechococcus sp. (strain ATCC 27167 / PCC 6312) TaxID=195253 RepID=UPI00029EDC25|nr:type 1 glutamine amidotransferase [Synechococcus sp. PCC 6312]AFY59454.1 GMP synthase family protein [Synechococcus sp. PCC 6312]
MSNPLRLHYIRHVPFEGPGNIAKWAESRGYSLTGTHLDQNDPFPGLDSFDWLVVMGGPMNVDQEADYPWLAAEKLLILEAINTGKTVLGVCLGAQLIASVLGGVVYPGPEKEIGWFPIELTTKGLQSQLFPPGPDQFMVFHWHGDTFTIPSGAWALGSSHACAQQGFLYDQRVLGLQCHLESTPESIQALLDHCADELVPGQYIQSAETIQAQFNYLPELEKTLFYVLDRLHELSVNAPCLSQVQEG